MNIEKPPIEKTPEVEKEKELEKLNSLFSELAKERTGKSLSKLDYEEIIRIGEEFKQLPEVKNFEARYGELTPISQEEFANIQELKKEKSEGLSKKKRFEEAKEYWGEDMWKLSEYYRRSEGAKKGWEKRKEGEKTFAEEAAEEEQKRAAEAKVMMGEELPEEAAAAEEDIETLKKKTREEYEKAGFKFEYKKEPEKKYRWGPQRELWIDKVADATWKAFDKMGEVIATFPVNVEKAARDWSKKFTILGLRPLAWLADISKKVFYGPKEIVESFKMDADIGFFQKVETAQKIFEKRKAETGSAEFDPDIQRYQELKKKLENEIIAHQMERKKLRERMAKKNIFRQFIEKIPVKG